MALERGRSHTRDRFLLIPADVYHPLLIPPPPLMTMPGQTEILEKLEIQKKWEPGNLEKHDIRQKWDIRKNRGYRGFPEKHESREKHDS